MSTDTTPPDRHNEFGLYAFLSAIILSVLFLAVGLNVAQRHSAAVLETQRLVRAEESRAACLERNVLFVPRVVDLQPLGDPWSDAWSEPPALEVPLQKQNIAMPMLENATVSSARLQGVTDGKRIAWRVSWKDDTLDGNVDTARFSDAVGLQFPVNRNAAFTMGGRGQRVQILHWKALWQKDVDEHYQDVQDLHPNYWADLYWFADGRPYKVPESFEDPRSHVWFAAYSAGNPLSNIYRDLPVEELVAEGYGTLTSQNESVTVGGGGWRNGEWSVVFARPMQTDDPQDYQFWRSAGGSVGLAVWDGAAGNVGGRKHWSNWVEFEVSP